MRARTDHRPKGAASAARTPHVPRDPRRPAMPGYDPGYSGQALDGQPLPSKVLDALPALNRLSEDAVPALGAVPALDHEPGPPAVMEIGRASCRERVCQYV